jgi:hypothetical protein
MAKLTLSKPVIFALALVVLVVAGAYPAGC